MSNYPAETVGRKPWDDDSQEVETFHETRATEMESIWLNLAGNLEAAREFVANYVQDDEILCKILAMVSEAHPRTTFEHAIINMFAPLVMKKATTITEEKLGYELTGGGE